jgi:hypothetical protein
MAARPPLLLPIALVALGVAILAGCIPLSGGGSVIQGKDASKSVGEAGSKKPLQKGNATLGQVLDVLGRPTFVDPAGRRLGYRWRTLNSSVWVLCAGVIHDESTATLVLQFDPSDRLVSFSVEKAWAGNDISAGTFDPKPPAGMTPFQSGSWPFAPAPDPQGSPPNLPPTSAPSARNGTAPAPPADPDFWNTPPATRPARKDNSFWPDGLKPTPATRP